MEYSISLLSTECREVRLAGVGNCACRRGLVEKEVRWRDAIISTSAGVASESWRGILSRLDVWYVELKRWSRFGVEVGI